MAALLEEPGHAVEDPGEIQRRPPDGEDTTGRNGRDGLGPGAVRSLVSVDTVRSSMSRKAEAERVSQLLFYGTVLLIGWLAYRIVQPFLIDIAWAVILAICLDPVRVRLLPRLGPTRTALLLTLAVVVLFVVPVVFVGTAVVAQGGPAVDYLQAQLQDQGGAARWFHTGWEWARGRAPFLPPEQEVIAKITSSVGRVAEFVAGQAGGLLKGVANFLFALVITLGVLFFLLRDAASFTPALHRVLPFGPEQNARLIALTSDLVSASVTATIVVAAVQGLIGGVTFALLGVSGAVLWGVMMFVLAFLPLVGRRSCGRPPRSGWPSPARWPVRSCSRSSVSSSSRTWTTSSGRSCSRASRR
jgi:predicted PurR-regulated permease PerM